MTGGVISGMDLLTATTLGESRVSASNADAQSDDQRFDGVLEQFIEPSADGETRGERLDALRSTIDTMDESEVLGFLAMLENQVNWQVEQQPVADVVDLQMWREQMQVSPDEVAGHSGERPLLSEAAGKALEKALEQYMPAEESEQKAVMVESLSKGIDVSRFAGDLSVEERLQSYRPAMDMKLQTVVEKAPEMLIMEHSQSSVELRGAVPSVADTTMVSYRAEAPATPVVSNPAVAQTATQANPEISLRQDNWSDAMGQRLVVMIGEGRQEAQIRLDPPELGVISVKLVIEEVGVSVQMASAVPQVRELLSVESDRLKFALEAQGYDQVDVNVGADSGSQFAQQERPSSGTGLTAVSDAVQPAVQPEAGKTQDLTTGIINTFA